MATVGELARQHTELTKEQTGHIVNLVGEWGMLADLCFADLMLHVPTTEGDWITIGQVRAATGQTLHISDFVGTRYAESDRPLIAECHRTGTIVEGEIKVDGIIDDCLLMAIPVKFDGSVIAVLTREWSRRSGRQPGELERTYLEMFDRFSQMVAAGGGARIRYASPNATSALHRVGITATLVGQTLAELGVIDSSVRQAFERCEPIVEEFEQTTEVTLLTRCIPIVENGHEGPRATGAVMLLRDVSELRRRDRMILSKDATIREIHHRVKNNLQTISSLLRLQGRRLESAEAKAAVAESVRRIRTIALVHETLSREPGD
ncbi:MAG: ATPase, partial [Actinobacteria bacterium]|nr:ATPase [Actinomycetota bacterium]